MGLSISFNILYMKCHCRLESPYILRIWFRVCLLIYKCFAEIELSMQLGI